MMIEEYKKYLRERVVVEYGENGHKSWFGGDDTDGQIIRSGYLINSINNDIMIYEDFVVYLREENINNILDN